MSIIVYIEIYCYNITKQPCLSSVEPKFYLQVRYMPLLTFETTVRLTFIH